MVLTREAAKKVLFDLNDGTIFTAIYIKKNGERRSMNCRKGVKKGITGAGHSYDPRAYNLICVYDMQKQDYRMININTLETLKLHGFEYKIEDTE